MYELFEFEHIRDGAAIVAFAFVVLAAGAFIGNWLASLV